MVSGTFPVARRNTSQQPLLSRRMMRSSVPVAFDEDVDAANVSDEDLLRLSAAGDESAFTALYRRRQGGVYRFALHMSGNGHVAEEVTQEVFMSLIREPQRFDPERGAFSSFLYGVARNHVLRCIHRDKVHVAMEADHAGELSAPERDLLSEMTRAETVEAVRLAVLTLPENYREVVALCDLEEMTYADAAAALSVPVGTVRSRLNRGRALLLEKLRAGQRGTIRCSV